MDFTLLTILIILIVIILIKHAYNRPVNFPPGPPRLPIWGSYWILLALNYKFPHLALQRLGKFYKTNILGFYLGQTPAIITLNYPTTFEMLTRPEFSNRQNNFVTKMRAFEQDLGIFFANGEFWKEQRRYSLRTMRDYGLGRRSPILENVVADEIVNLMEIINQGPKNPIEKEFCLKPYCVLMPHVFFRIFQSAFWQILTGEPFPENLKLQQAELIQNILKFQRVGEPLGGALVYTPWLRHILPNFSGFNGVRDSNSVILKFFVDQVNEIKKSLIEDSPRGYIDEYLIKLKQKYPEEYSTFSEEQLLITLTDQRIKLKQKYPEEYSTFSEEQLLITLTDHIIPSTVANSTVLAFIFTHLVHNPSIQTKIQEEIDFFVGTGRLPTLDDRPKLVYTEATIKEGLRRDALNPLGIFRECIKDTYLGGYFIPKGTFVLPGNHAVNMDPDLWTNPEEFQPERFIDSDGKLVKKDYALLFGAGSRVCVGETFSRQNLFLVFAGLLQNYTFSIPEGCDLPDLDYQNYINGINVAPKEFWINVTPRK